MRRLLVRGERAWWRIRARWSPPSYSSPSTPRIVAPLPDGGWGQALLARHTPSFFFEPSDAGSVAHGSVRAEPERRQAIVAEADQITRGRIELFGYGRLDVGRPPRWTTDPVTGFRWPMTHYTRFDWQSVVGRADARHVWELNRCHHFVTLGLARVLTGKETFTAAFHEQFSSWAEGNPPEYGPNWAIAMEAAIRSVNLLWSAYLFAPSPALDREFWKRFVSVLGVHGEFILRNLEDWGERSNNHLIADAVGLIYLGLLLPEVEGAGRWLSTGLALLDREVPRQTLSDGVNFERSIPYHGFVLEMCLSALALCRRNGLSLGKNTKAAMERMAEFTSHYLRPDASYPDIGDRDDGRLHPLGSSVRSFHATYLEVAAELFERPDLSREPELRNEAYWLLPESRKARRAPAIYSSTSPSASHRTKVSRGFPDGGFFLMVAPDLHLAVVTTKIGDVPPSGHQHNHALGVDLWARGRSLLVDPGTYAYSASPQRRTLFRSTSFHNTLMVDGREIVDLGGPDAPFAFLGSVSPEVVEWAPGDSAVVLVARHRGYERLGAGLVHERRVVLHRDLRACLVEDRVLGTGRHLVEIHFQLGDAPLAIEEDGRVVRTVWEEGGNLGIAVLSARPEPDAWEAEEIGGWTSPRYGLKVRSRRVRFRVEETLPITHSVMLLPHGHPDQFAGLRRGLLQVMKHLLAWSSIPPMA